MQDYWSSDRSTAPPTAELISTEQRAISIGLADAIILGETIVPTGITARLTRWRDGIDGDPAALVGAVSYDATTKVATQRIDASKLPPRVPMVLTITFSVNNPSTGSDVRAVYIALSVVV